MLDIFTYSFMIRAFIAGAAIAVVAPLIGNFLVIKRLSLIADTLSHIALSGVAIGFLLRTEPMITTIIATTAAALAIEYLRIKQKLPGEALLAMFLPGGLAVSLILMSVANGFSMNLFSYLFGSITTVTEAEVWIILGLGLVITVTVTGLYRKLLYTSFDEEGARVSGIPVDQINTLLIVLTAVTISLAMKIVGVLLIGALMVIPVITATQVARSFTHTIIYSIVFAILAVLIGLAVSFYASLPAGATIVMISLGLFAISTVHKSY